LEGAWLAWRDIVLHRSPRCLHRVTGAMSRGIWWSTLRNLCKQRQNSLLSRWRCKMPILLEHLEDLVVDSYRTGRSAFCMWLRLLHISS
jgi:hypothetical protein